MEQDSERGGVGGEDDELGDTTVKSLGRLVGALFDLAIMGALLYLVCVNRRREVCVSQRTRSKISWDRAWSAWGQAALLSSAILKVGMVVDRVHC